jgi:hypothetical protein
MPFFLVYEAEALFPPEVITGSLHIQTYDKATPDQLWCDDVELINERRWQSAIKNARYCQVHRCHHQRFMHSKELQVDDLVLRRMLTWEGANKLSPGWEGSFWVTQVCHPRCVHLAMEDGESLPNP